MIDPELKYLVALFEDEDEIVTEAVNKRILDKGPSVLGTAKYLARQEPDINKRNLIKSRLEFFRAVFTLADLEEFVRDEEIDQYYICSGLIHITALLDPNFSERKFQWEYDQIADRFYLDFPSDRQINLRTAVENVNLFNYNFFEMRRFSICDAMMSDEKSGLINFILSRKKGNPIALSALYLSIATELGLPFKLMCFPGGFIPAYVENGKVLFYVNIFNEGAILHENNLQTFLDRQGVDRHAQAQMHIREPETILTIYLESMLFIYSNMSSGMSKTLLVEKALDIFGSERFLTIDEEDSED